MAFPYSFGIPLQPQLFLKPNLNTSFDLSKWKCQTIHPLDLYCGLSISFPERFLLYWYKGLV